MPTAGNDSPVLLPDFRLPLRRRVRFFFSVPRVAEAERARCDETPSLLFALRCICWWRYTSFKTRSICDVIITLHAETHKRSMIANNFDLPINCEPDAGLPNYNQFKWKYTNNINMPRRLEKLRHILSAIYTIHQNHFTSETNCYSICHKFS